MNNYSDARKAACQGERGIPHKRMRGGYAAKAPLHSGTVVKQWSQGGLIDALLSIPLTYILKYGFRTNGGIANIYVQGGNWEVFQGRENRKSYLYCIISIVQATLSSLAEYERRSKLNERM